MPRGLSSSRGSSEFHLGLTKGAATATSFKTAIVYCPSGLCSEWKDSTDCLEMKEMLLDVISHWSELCFAFWISSVDNEDPWSLAPRRSFSYEEAEKSKTIFIVKLRESVKPDAADHVQKQSIGLTHQCPFTSSNGKLPDFQFYVTMLCFCRRRPFM